MHEIIVPFVRAASAKRTEYRSRATGHAPVKRVFAPGSDWIYARLYTGESVADSVLIGTIAPLAERFQQEAISDRWFFLRYRDPEFTSASASMETPHASRRTHCPHCTRPDNG